MWKGFYIKKTNFIPWLFLLFCIGWLFGYFHHYQATKTKYQQLRERETVTKVMQHIHYEAVKQAAATEFAYDNMIEAQGICRGLVINSNGERIPERK